MKTETIRTWLAVSLLLLFTTSTYPNFIWPPFILAHAIYSSLFLVVISIAIEALLLYWFIKNVSYIRALFISFVGNTISTLIGTAITVLTIMVSQSAFDRLWGRLDLDIIFSAHYIISSYLFMYLGTALIEMIVIKLFFRYPIKQIWIPVMIGNFITYALVAVFKFHKDIVHIFKYIVG